MKYAFCFLVLFGCGCNNHSSGGSNLNSRDIDSRQERVAMLSKHIIIKSAIIDCEFDLFNVNGFGNDRLSVPGASSWNYKFAVLVNKEDVVKWTAGAKDTSFSQGFDWKPGLIQKRKEHWKLTSKPVFFIRDSADVIFEVYPEEGVIFEQISNK